MEGKILEAIRGLWIRFSGDGKMDFLRFWTLKLALTTNSQQAETCSETDWQVTAYAVCIATLSIGNAML